MALRLHGCPRCAGSLVEDADDNGWTCLSCARTFYEPNKPVTPRPGNSGPVQDTFGAMEKLMTQGPSPRD